AQPALEVLAKELAHGYVEAALFRIEQFARQQRLRPALEKDLFFTTTAGLEFVGQRQAEFHDPVVQKGHPALQSHTHQWAIQLDQKVVGQRSDQVSVLPALQVRPAAR